MQLLSLIARYSDVLFAAAIIAMFVRMYAVRRGDLRLAIKTSWVSMVVAAPLALLSLISGLTGHLISLLMAAMWGWVAYSSYQEIRSTGWSLDSFLYRLKRKFKAKPPSKNEPWKSNVKKPPNDYWKKN